jgi:hypothetical protein
MGLLGEVNIPLLQELTTIISPFLGWTQKEAKSEVERTVQLLKKVHGVTFDK